MGKGTECSAIIDNFTKPLYCASTAANQPLTLIKKLKEIIFRSKSGKTNETTQKEKKNPKTLVANL